MIDLLKIRTYTAGIISILLKLRDDRFKLVENEGYSKIYSNSNGIKIICNVRSKEVVSVDIIFSPHKQANNNKHNANAFSLLDAQKSIISTMRSLGIEWEQYSDFIIMQLEIGVNYHCPKSLSPQLVLDSFLMLVNSFFQRHPKHHHYRFAEGTNRKRSNSTGQDHTKAKASIKLKHYWKASQSIDSENKTLSEFGYCKGDVIRTEVKCQRTGKIKELGFETLNDLFRHNALEGMKNFLRKQLDNVFVFNPAEIDKTKLKKEPQRKLLYQCITPDYWKKITGRKLTETKRKWNLLPKKFNTKEIIVDAILDAIDNQNITKNVSCLSTSVEEQATVGRPHNQRDLPKTDHIGYTIDGTNTTSFCVITGEDISMQDEGRPYLKREGMRFIYKNNHRRFLQLKRRFVNEKYWNSDLMTIIIQMEHNIRHTHDNKKYNQQRMVERIYHPSQPQLNFTNN